MRDVAICQLCARALPDAARFCPACGAAAHGPESPTFTSSGVMVGAAGTARVATATPGNVVGGRFVPGMVLAGRYRIVALLGRGGMGEVYRADDLLLEQPVALKFLPLDLANDPARLARLRGEVRAARQVSHPHVCRVYDIGEADGHQFLSMEYVDGEDLGSLLRRIGRLPQGKGVEIAHQVCAGLAAAHERGVLHRDLKPANVMLDGRGQVRIADFGLAGAAATDEVPAGTPSYMAPEQFEGRPASVQSDLYALGLLLYELFTGKPVFAPGSLLAVAQAHREQSHPNATTEVPDLDPAIDRAIQRCLATQPGARPTSALLVAASLPGGDPLAAALARGETPSPSMVAAAGGEGMLRPVIAFGLWLVVIAGLLTLVPLTERINPIRAVAMPHSPEVLRDRARQIIRHAGYTDAPVGATGGFSAAGFLNYLGTLPAAERWWHLQNDEESVEFWYRESPSTRVNFFGLETRVSPSWRVERGMRRLLLDARGRLVNFSAVPDRAIGARAEAFVDWTPLFNAAGLDQREFIPSAPRWRPLYHAEVRVAWQGRPNASSGRRPLWIEGGAADGMPTYFETFQPWEDRDDPFPPLRPRLVLMVLTIAMLLLLTAAALLLTSHNLRTRRGDVRGATRVAIFMFCLAFCGSALGSDYAADPLALFFLLLTVTAKGMLLAGFIWVGYVAIEPHVRRWWPETLISWTRVVDGRWRDPRVARDLLIGMTLAVVTLNAAAAASLGAAWPANTEQRLVNIPLLDGGRFFAAWITVTLRYIVAVSVAMLLLLVILTIVTRRKWAGFAGTLVVFGVLAVLTPGTLLERVTAVAIQAAVIGVVARVGILASVVGGTMSQILSWLPLTFDPSVWYAPYGWTILAGIAVAATYTFHFARGRQPLFARSLLE